MQYKATPCQVAILARSLETWRYVQHRVALGFCGSKIQSSKTHEDVGLGQRGIVFHLPAVQTGPSLLVASFCLLSSHRNTEAGGGGYGRPLFSKLPGESGQSEMVRTSRDDSITKACNPEPLT